MQHLLFLLAFLVSLSASALREENVFPDDLDPPPPLEAAIYAPVAQEDSKTEHQKVVAFLLRQTPLMVIRFNRPHIAYDGTIQKVTKQTLGVSKNANFVLLGKIPKTNDPAFTQKSQLFLSEHIAHIQDLLKQAQITSGNIQEYLVLDSPSGFNEIALFVQ